MADSIDQDAMRPLTKEEFNAFHNIDRNMFFRLVFNLQRDPVESMKVMAVLLWLEQTGQAPNLVYNTLRWSNTLVHALANEAVQCLQCIESNEFPSALEGLDVLLIQTMTKGRVSLRFFHDNRLHIIHEIDKNVDEVCVRAFEDILEQLKQSKGNAGVEDRGEQGENLLFPVVPPVVPGLVMADVNSESRQLDVYDLGIQRQAMNDKIKDIISRLQDCKTSKKEEKREVEAPADHRTIFLTFSKGYPISEKEVRDFFTRKFGDCIEAIYMQEVPAEEQPLYARLVVQPPSSLEKILGGSRRAKFYINGKHLWGRKYVPKKQKSPPPSSTPS